MTEITLTAEGQILFDVDTSIYKETIIDKVLYGYAGKFIITRKNQHHSALQTIKMSASYPIGIEEFSIIRKKLSADFIDYKNRAIIAEETRDLRNILYVKAFANNDNFVEFDFED